MSTGLKICDWTDDGWRCELYCWRNDFGRYITHVSTHRYPDDCPEQPSLALIPREDGGLRHAAIVRFADAARVRHAWINAAVAQAINGPHDGARFEDTSLRALLERMLLLRQDGYRVPDSVLERVRWMCAYRREARLEDAEQGLSTKRIAA